jgi:hypothetical protein
MSTTPQHGTHPDAEVLSAFAEQALGGKQRGEVLKHLALCGRCRRVVALADEAANAEVVAQGQKARHVPQRPRRWWRGWGLALAPIAAVAATAVIAVYVHERIVERDAEVAGVERQQADERPPVVPQASPQAPSHVAAPEEAPANAPAESAKRERMAAKPRPSLAEASEPPAALPAPADLPVYAPLATHAEPAESSRSERHRTDDDKAVAPEAAHDGAREAQAAVYDEGMKRQAEEKFDRRLLAATAPPPPSEHEPGDAAAGGGTAGSNRTADLQAQQVEIESAPSTGGPRIHGLGSMAGMISSPRAFRLPSGLHAVSIAHAERRILAVDEAGTLYFSKDSGEKWEKVKRQWLGRVVAVRRHEDGTGAAETAPAPESAGVITSPGAVSHPDTVFELVNDKSQVWVSQDGKIWTAK